MNKKLLFSTAMISMALLSNNVYANPEADIIGSQQFKTTQTATIANVTSINSALYQNIASTALAQKRTISKLLSKVKRAHRNN